MRVKHSGLANKSHKIQLCFTRQTFCSKTTANPKDQENDLFKHKLSGEHFHFSWSWNQTHPRKHIENLNAQTDSTYISELHKTLENDKNQNEMCQYKKRKIWEQNVKEIDLEKY